MHQSLDGAHGVVADRVVALGRIADELAGVGDELARDRVGGVAGLNKRRERRRKADRVALGDRLELVKPFRRRKPCFDQGSGGGQALSRSLDGHAVGQAMPACGVVDGGWNMLGYDIVYILREIFPVATVSFTDSPAGNSPRNRMLHKL